MTKDELQTKINGFIEEETADEKSKNTIRKYKHVATLFVNSLPDGEIQKSDIVGVKDKLLHDYKISTVNNYIVIINKFIKYAEIVDSDDDFNFLKLKKYYSKNLLKNVRVQKDDSLDDILEPNEFQRLLKKAREINRMDLYEIMKVFGYTGIRLSELQFFTVEAVADDNVYVMNKGKGRGIILRSDLRRELLKYCKDNKIEEGCIFTSSDKKSPVNARVLSRDLKMIAGKCRGIKLGKVHPHAFRHLFAIQYLMQNGENAIAELADILGHSSLETTRIYVRTTRKMKKQNLESLSYAKRK